MLLGLFRFEARIVPDATWTGMTDTDWTTPTNWNPNGVPGNQDVVTFSGTTLNPPVVKVGTNAEAFQIKMAADCAYNLTVNGALTTWYSKIGDVGFNAVHGIVGDGTLNLDCDGTAFNHDWISGYVKVRNANIQNGATVQVRSNITQLGPDDAGENGSLWVVGAFAGDSLTAGALFLEGGLHKAGFDKLLINKDGLLKSSGSGTGLLDVGYGPAPNAPWTPFVVENHGNVEVAEDGGLALWGGTYLQISDVSLESPVTTLQARSSLSTATFVNATATPDYAIDVRAGKLIAFVDVEVRTTTNIRVENAVIDFYSPGVYSRNGFDGMVSDFRFTAKDGMTAKNVLIEDTPVSFLDWTPDPSYSNMTQMNGRISVDGKIELAGTTELKLRLNVGGLSGDSIVVINPAGSATLTGNNLKLTVRLKNLPVWPGMFSIQYLISAPALNAPNPPFGGGTTVANPPAGWSYTPAYTVGNSVTMTFVKYP
jgi:hypothetical protein